MAEQCESMYTRPAALGVPGLQTIMCTYIKGHTGRHSWETLKFQDVCDLERERALTEPGAEDDLPSDVAAILENITEGRADPYLEAILAVTHNRKKALRNVPGFRRSR